MLRPSLAAFKIALTLVTLTFATAFCISVRAEETYPSRQITIVVPYPAGGVVDLTARLIAEALRETFGTPAIVLNKPGANGMIALAEFVRTPADGYTLLINNDGGIAIPPAVDPNFKWDPMNDYTPVAQVGEFTWVLLVNPDLRVSSIKELIAYAKANPGTLSYGTPGIGTLPHMATEMFSKRIGAPMTHVPYKGAAPALSDLMGGILSLNIQSIPTVAGQTSSSRLRALAVLSERRVKALPNIPTMQESGLDGFTISSWNGVFAPPNLPTPIRDKLAKALVDAMRSPAVQAKFQTLSLDPVATDAATFAKRYHAEVAKWKTIAADSNIRIAP
jgi:tripartite-type tricarboxylate transporter receptor subunit TctC